MTLSLTAGASDGAGPKSPKVKSTRFDVWTMGLLWFGRQCYSAGYTQGLLEGRAKAYAERLKELISLKNVLALYREELEQNTSSDELAGEDSQTSSQPGE